MRSSRALKTAIALAGFAVGATLPLAPASAQRPASDGIQLAGRTVRCGSVRIVSDRHIPSEGAAAPGVLILNPGMLNAQPPVVRLFVFHHECGHHTVGESELKADCWAVQQGVRDGWLDAKGLSSVCQSFEDAPETPTHPSGRRRCRNLDQCFATAVASLRAAKPASPAPAARASVEVASATPRLVSGPKLVGTGTLRYSNGVPCKSAATKPADGMQAKTGACP